MCKSYFRHKINDHILVYFGIIWRNLLPLRIRRGYLIRICLEDAGGLKGKIVMNCH